MARTKQTAGRSTGGTAPKGALNSSGAGGATKPVGVVENVADPRSGVFPAKTTRRTRSSTAASSEAVARSVKATQKQRSSAAKRRTKERSASPPPSSKEDRDKFCYLCQNGGRSYACSDCPRVVCTSHLLHDHIPAHDMVKLCFICPSCHIRYVRRQRKDEKKLDQGFQVLKLRVDPKYRAFYRKEGAERVAHLSQPVRVAVPFHVSHHARVKTSAFGILKLRLRAVRGDGSIARVIHEAMKQYFVEEEEVNLIYREVEFDLNSDADVEKHQRAIMEALAPFARTTGGRLFVFIYTHADEETGTLFFGENLAAQTLRNWFDVLLPEDARSILREHSTTVFMLACGALLAVDAAYAELKEHCLSLRVTRLFAFEAGAFQAAFATPFFLIYTYKFIIENATFDDHQLGILLSSSLYLGRHSKIVLMSSSDDWKTLSVAEYLYSSRGTRPWGEQLPVQCAKCHALRTYEVQKEKNGNFTARCSETDCTSLLVFKQRVGDVVLKGLEGVWLKRARA